MNKTIKTKPYHCPTLISAIMIFSAAISITMIVPDISLARSKAAVEKTSDDETEKADTEDTDKIDSKTEKKKHDPAETDEKRAELIEQTLDFGTQEERGKAIDRIRQVRDAGIKTRLVKKLIDILKDETDPEVLVKSLTLFGEVKEQSAVPLLMEKLDHPSEDVRIASVYAIKALNASSAREKVVQKMKDQNLENNNNFIVALLFTLGELKAVEIVPYLNEALTSNKTNTAVKENIILFFATVQAREAKSTLVKLYRDEEEDTTIRSYAVNALARMGMKDIAPDIKEVIKKIESLDIKKRKKFNTLHLYSVAALAKLGDPDAVPKLINALRSNSPDIRLKAVSLIKEFKEKRTIDILKYKMKYDQSPKVRSAAKKALVEMGVEEKEEKKK